MEIYAHRAGRGLAAENTLFACDIALEFPINYIDFDVGMTKEGELVVTHDVTLNPDITRDDRGRFIPEGLPIASLTYPQLVQYNVGQINPISPYAKYFPQQKSSPYAPIPKLREAIAYVQERAPDVKFQIEIKTDGELIHPPAEFSSVLNRLLIDLDIIEITEVQSFDWNCLHGLRKKNGAIKTTFLTHPAEISDSLFKVILELGGECWGPFQMDVDPFLIEEAKRWGLKIVPWGYPEKEGTEFNLSQIEKLMSWGVDGIITDRPDKLHKLFKEYKL